MACKNWQAKELFPVAGELARILLREKNVTGIAITGSVARFEPHCHDIDLVVFHNGHKANASFAHGATVSRSSHGYGGFEIYTVDHLKELVAEPIFRELSEAKSEFPVHYVFIQEKILWDCAFLQSFLPPPSPEKNGFFARIGSFFGGSTKGMEDIAANEFHSTVFCDIPLFLLEPACSHGALLRYAQRREVAWEPTPFSESSFLNIRHECEDMRCKPTAQWESRRWGVKVRLGYECATEELRRREATKGGLSSSMVGPGALSYPQDGEVSLTDSNEPT